MNKNLLIGIAAVILVGLLIAGYFYWQKSKDTQTPIQQAGDAAEKLSESASKGTLPSMDVKSNPLEGAQNTNPVDQTNPFKNIKTNPFE